MRAFRTITFVGAVGAAVLAFAGSSIAQDLIPERRLVLTDNTDLPGGDLQSIFDTTLEACERACLTNPSCTAFTFNTLKGACFPKSAPGGYKKFCKESRVPVDSGRVIKTTINIDKSTETPCDGNQEIRPLLFPLAVL